MRLICPNCDAEYEVPDEVIPSEGRDVQCSNCGDTWFQNHADSPAPVEAEPESAPAAAAQDFPADANDIDAPDSETKREVEEPQQESVPVQIHLDSSVKDILREEATLEAQIRAKETGNSIESQPDLGLDDIADESNRRAQEAQERMARIRGIQTGADAPAEAGPISVPDSRRGLLPDIEQINSTLHAEGNKPKKTTEVGPVSVSAKAKRKNSFTRGFAVAIILSVAMAMVYIKAPQIAQSFPQVDPALNAYVAGVDKTRLWLDNKIGDLVPNDGG